MRRSSQRIRVTANEQVLAESTQAKVLSETGLPNRYYIPATDVRTDLLVTSETRTVCPYKGRASYRSLPRDGGIVADVVWTYPDPLENALALSGHYCFLHDDIAVDINDGA